MYIVKAIILFISFLSANEGSFRGKNLNDVLSGPIPISYSNFISNEYIDNILNGDFTIINVK